MTIRNSFFAISLLSSLTLGQTLKPANVPETATKHDSQIITGMTSQSFQQFLQAMGFECTRGKDEAGKDETYFTFRAEGYKIAVFINDPSSIELYNAFTDVNPTQATVNEWNQNNRFSRAYVDKEGNAVIENDLILTGGVTNANVETFVKTFRDTVARWARFVLDRKK